MIILQLSVRAESAVERCQPGWLSHAGGVETLLDFLERKCVRQAVPDVGQELENFLVRTKRRKGEPMQQWADRFETGHQYLRKALARAVEVTEGDGVRPLGDGRGPGAVPWRRRWHWVELQGIDDAWTWDWDDEVLDVELEEPAQRPQEAPEVFPRLVRGWLLLVRSGLDSMERAAILSSTRGLLECEAIRDALNSN